MPEAVESVLYVLDFVKDGVAAGRTRFNLLGKDLNRDWSHPADPRLAPENDALESWLKRMIAQGKPPPGLQVIAVMNVSTIFGVRRLAALAVSLGASTLTVQDLVMDYSERVSDVDIRHISTLPPDRIIEATRELIEAKKLAESHGCSVVIHPSIYDTVLDAMQAMEGGQSGSIVSVAADDPRLGRH